MTTPLNPGFHRAVAAEIDRRVRNDKDSAYYDRLGLDEILSEAFVHIQNGSTINAGASIIAARAYLQRHFKNPMQEAVEEFMKRCDQEVKKFPDLPEEQVVTLRIRLMVEELLGKISAPVEAIRDEDDHRYTRLLIENKSDELIASMIAGDLTGIADGLSDVLYVVFGTAAAYGIDIQEVFNEVHRSNLSKTVWNEDEKRYIVQKDEFGKTIKPRTYSPANIEPIIRRQIDNGQAWEDFYADQAQNSEIVLGKIDG